MPGMRCQPNDLLQSLWRHSSWLTETEPGIIALHASGRVQGTSEGLRTGYVTEQSMITVQVRLFATLRRQFPGLGIGEAMTVELAEGATVDQLLAKLQLAEERAKIIVVNNIIQEVGSPLTDGDEVGIFPPVGGG